MEWINISHTIKGLCVFVSILVVLKERTNRTSNKNEMEKQERLPGFGRNVQKPSLGSLPNCNYCINYYPGKYKRVIQYLHISVHSIIDLLVYNDYL